MQYLFVNGRWVRDRSLGHAMQEAYRGLLMTGRYAVAFLFLELPPEQVDVNVHPTKAEVRFRDGHFLYSLVLGSIRERLSAENLTARLKVTSTLEGPQQPPTAPPLSDPLAWFEPRVAPTFTPLTAPPLPSAPVPLPPMGPSAGVASPAPVAPAPAPPPPVGISLPGVVPVNAIQLHNSYLVLETAEGMLVIDQHALHERILFEQFKRRIRTGTLETQQLLIPETVELTAEQAARALEAREDLAALGLGIEDFGNGTLLLTGYPALLGNRSPQATLKAVVDHLCGKDRPPTREHLFNDLLSLMACHSAVRAGDPLTPDEIAALVAQRQLADDTHHCPHGRPTALLFSRQDLDRQFRRV
jgi:DNA mismatch repair protein MutL